MTTRIEPTHVYVGRVPGCGCIEAFRVDSPDDPKRTGKAVGEMVKQGYEIERVPYPAAHLRLTLCPHAAVPKLAQRGALLALADDAGGVTP